MTEAILLLVLLAVAIGLLATEWVPIEVTALGLLLVLFATGLGEPAELFAGFGNEVIVFLGGLFVVTAALVRTGALALVESRLARVAEQRPRRLTVLLLAAVGVISALLSNTATMAAFLPLAMALSRRVGRPASKLLMPLAFAAILGGTCTLVGTSANIVVAGAMPDLGLTRLGFLELARVGVPVLVIGVAFLVRFGDRLLPSREGGTLDAYGVRDYLAEVRVPGGSPWIGRTLRETQVRSTLGLNVLGRTSEDGRIEALARDAPLVAEDRLLVKAEPAALLALADHQELSLVGQDLPEARRQLPVHEVLVTPGSLLSGQTLREIGMRERFGISVLAIHRRGATTRLRVADLELADGDVLLVQGDLAGLDWLLREGEVLVLDRMETPRRGWQRWWAISAFAAMIVGGAFGWVPFSVGAVAAAVVVFAAGCLTPAEAYGAIEWRILILVGSMLAVAGIMESGGAADLIAGWLLAVAGSFHPVVLLGAVYVLTVALTQPLSNQVAALLVLPVAVEAARSAGLEPRAFAITVCLAASSSFVTPFEPACLLVFGPGRYRFADYVRLGLPLTLLVLALTLALVPVFWPL